MALRSEKLVDRLCNVMKCEDYAMLCGRMIGEKKGVSCDGTAMEEGQ